MCDFCTCTCMYMYTYVFKSVAMIMIMWFLVDMIKLHSSTLHVHVCSFVSVDYKFGVCVQQELNGEVIMSFLMKS